MLHVENVQKAFNGQPVVRDLSFSVAAGETFVLIGRSGCGKTTTLKMINRLVEPDAGSIQLAGMAAATSVEAMRRQIGYVVQSYGLFPHLSVRDNIAVVPRLLGHSKATEAQQVEVALQRVALDASVLDAFPDALSGGQQQRVAIARAIAAEPPLLLMDEPFSALDPMTRGLARANFRQMVAQLNTATVLVTHDVAEAVTLADRIGLMENGRFLQVGTPMQLLFEPASEAVISQGSDSARSQASAPGTELPVSSVPGELLAQGRELAAPRLPHRSDHL